MKKVTILCLDNTMATTIFGPMDILNQAGRLFNRLEKSLQTPFFDITIVSPDGHPIRSVNNIMIQPHCSIKEIDKTDLIIIASATYIEKILDNNPELVPWIQDQYKKGAHVASICTGVFLLAETGLLDGKSATLHWGFTKIFEKRYPKINLRHDKMYIDHGRLYCSAGVSAGMDLSLYLVEKFCGKKAAVQSAKTMVLDMGREVQTPYDCNLFVKEHGDFLIIKCQSWIEKHQTQTIDYNILARKFTMSRRSLERRFKQAAGMTPLGYLQLLRVEKAKHLLEQTSLSFNEITYEAGYEDVPFFRKIFVRLTGLRPKEYQQRFAGSSARKIMP
ncbi:MAG: helix-turn-helix domain-containing protein [Deltaproteobacteria bacterium]|jgi:transcriptional regulator GlxA family with amidase domain|nr:helix-turn-helix domain-containing protein [Deltaproteobacteria bacterium]